MDLPRVLLLDVDGTLWKIGKALPGIPQAVETFKKMGIRVIILTNNNSGTRKEFTERLEYCGIHGIHENDVISSAYATALQMKKANVKKAYVTGFSGLKAEIKAQGIKLYDYNSSQKFPVVDAITVANPVNFDISNFSRIATIFKRSPNCLVFGANPDMTNIVNGKVILGSGAIVSIVSRMLNVNAANIGKPSVELMEILLEQLNCKPSEMMMVGDRLPTDIVFGAQNGMKTVFVLTGVDKQENVNDLAEELRPTFTLSSLAKLPELFAKVFKPPVMKTPSIRAVRRVIKTPKLAASQSRTKQNSLAKSQTKPKTAKKTTIRKSTKT